MFDVYDGFRHRGFDAVRNESGDNLGEQLFVFDEEKRDEHHCEKSDGKVNHYSPYRAYDAGDREVRHGIFQVVEQHADGIEIFT